MFYKLAKRISGPILPLNTLHVLNDGFQASFVLLLPFIAHAQGLRLTEVGLLGTTLNISSIILALPAGYIAAQIGGMRTLVLALFVYGMALLGAGLIGSLPFLLIMFCLAGVGFGVFHPIAFALIAKWSTKEARGRIIGNFTAIGDVGRVAISAAVSFISVAIGWQRTAILYAVGVLIVAVVAYRLLQGNVDTATTKERHTQVPLSLWQIIRNLRFILAICAGSLDAFASASLFVFLPFLLLKRGIDPALLGTFTATFFIGNFFGKTALGRLVDRFGNVQVFIAAEVLMALFIFLLANAVYPVVIIVCSVVLGIFTKGTVPVQQTMLTESVEHHGNFEKAFGFAAIISTSVTAAAPILLGALSDNHGIVSAFNVMAIVALVAVLPSVLFFRARSSATM